VVSLAPHAPRKNPIKPPATPDQGADRGGGIARSGQRVA
jgi:hypothetical protein